MDKVATGIMIAAAALVMSGSFVRDALAEQSVRMPLEPGAPLQDPPSPATVGLRSEQALNLVLVLEALRAAPATMLPFEE
jgi:hypothetical protein